MSCYAYREDTARLVDLFNRTVAPVVGRCYLGTHLCFGNFKARAAGPRRYEPMFPAFLELDADELHLEMASREFAELELIEEMRPLEGRRGRHRRRQELVRGDAGGRRGADSALPASHLARAARGRPRLRALTNGPLGRAGEAGRAGRGREACARDRSELRLEGERARRVADEDLVGELGAELAFEPRLEPREDVVDPGPPP